ncbi:flagellar assembly protein FliH [Bacillus sp. ISL-18]|uniref:FliH/SctL family protein n=1 Tax=Bacillus sp. ISL-18 TaxID=2819118 RepID=UPI001BE9092F|nr:FliH/SctL family protein [Bacillus sp. ISL-18]MBT2657833.1 flagellar assembly protein FliH [Bacillus sp. ISL-18]
MISYSKVFKASQLSISDEVKIIKQPFVPKLVEIKTNAEGVQVDLDKSTIDTPYLLHEAEKKAQEIIAQAEETIRLREQETEEKMAVWWQENEIKLSELSQQANEQGYQDGYSIGQAEAREQIEQEYRHKLEQIQEILENAYQQKEAIIAEAEPFLLELSTVIAAQIVKQELETHPDKFLELIRQHILRFKEKEFITVCVHPDDFEFIQNERNHLVAVVNGETEIKIITDHSVSPKGCIIRTAYGSIDARIDTQIDEVKKAILEARREPESDFIS